MTVVAPTSRPHQSIGVRSVAGALGAEITGVDLAQPLDDDVFDEIQQAFYDHLVIFFRAQTIGPADQVAFTERFGPTAPHPLGIASLDGHPQVMVLENRPGKLAARNDFWHSDISFGECPPALSMLYAIEVTEGRADTMFTNMYAAYEGLSERLRTILDGLDAMHDAEQLVNESALPRPGAGGPAGRRSSGRAHTPGQRPQGAVRQPLLYRPFRRHDAAGKPTATPVPLPARHPAREHIPT